MQSPALLEIAAGSAPYRSIPTLLVFKSRIYRV